jgi:hypothetical protein
MSPLLEIPMNRRPESLALIVLMCVAGAGCDTLTERSFYEGMRQGNDQAARRTGPAAVPQSQPLPSYDAYERERQRLRNAAPAASAAGGT